MRKNIFFSGIVYAFSFLFLFLVSFRLIGPDNKYYHQLEGLDTGSQFSPSYANIWWSTYETPIIKKYKKDIEVYDRFIDDIFTIWNDTKQKAEEFIQELNQQHPNIKLEGLQIAQIGESVNFLDLNISWDMEDYDPVSNTYGIKRKINQKSLNAYQYLPPYSQHPPWVLKI